MTESDNPTFAIMGSGGMGGYIGAKLIQAGYQDSFIALGAHIYGKYLSLGKPLAET